MSTMKISIYSPLAAIALFCTTACEKELATYSETNGVYFSMTEDEERIDTAKVTFAYTPAFMTDTTVLIPVRTLGVVSAEDRKFDLRVVPENTTAVKGQHYEELAASYTIPAGKNIFQLPVTLHRTAEMLTDTFQLQVELMANEHFNQQLQDEIVNAATGQKVSLVRFTIQINDVLSKPLTWWDYMLGIFSRKKLLLISGISGERLADFNDRTIITISKLTFLGKYMQKYLNDEAAKGNVILDEDGTPMVMGQGAQ